MPAVQTEYRERLRPTPPKQSIWLVIDDVPGDDIEALDALKDQLVQVVREKARSEVSGGIAESDKLRIFVKER